MNDRYVADIGDWAKFRVLRCLLAAAEHLGTELRPAVLWWKTLVAGGAEGDGRHTGYLREPSAARFSAIDSDLHTKLKHILDKNERAIDVLERSAIMPEETIYHSEPLDFPTSLTTNGRRQWRSEWVRRARDAVQAATLIFADPDNGLAPTGGSRTDRQAHKRVWPDELRTILSPEQSMVVYHHLDRTAPAAQQSMRIYDRLSHEFPGHAPSRLLLFRRQSLRFFAFVPAVQHAAAVDEAVRRLTSGAESMDFELMLPSAVSTDLKDSQAY